MYSAHNYKKEFEEGKNDQAVATVMEGHSARGLNRRPVLSADHSVVPRPRGMLINSE